MSPSEPMNPFVAPTTTEIVMWVDGVEKTNHVVKGIAMENGLKSGIANPMALQDMASVPIMSMDAVLPAFAKEINITDSACNQLLTHDEDAD